MKTSLTAQVAAAMAASHELSDWIEVHHPGSFNLENGSRIAAALYSIALDHREAILLLLEHGARSAAFALVRSVYEAWVRASWAHNCATPTEIQHIERGGFMPKVETMIRRLDALPDSGGIYSHIKRIEWDPMSDYAHGEQRQISRWIDEAGIGAIHSDDEVEEVLRILDLYAILSCCGLTTLAGKPNAHYLAKVEELGTRFAAAEKSRQP